MIIIMILLMILNMNDSKVMLIEMLSFLNDFFFMLQRCLFKVFVLPELDVWDVMYSCMLYIWWNTVLINVLKSSGSSVWFYSPLAFNPYYVVSLRPSADQGPVQMAGLTPV